MEIEKMENRMKTWQKGYKLSNPSIYCMFKKCETTSSIKNKRGRDRKPKTSIREDFVIVRFAQKKNKISSREILEVLKFNVSALTVRLIIKNSRLISCIQRKRPYISKQNMANMPKNTGLSKDLISKVSRFWDCVLWSGDSKYELFG
ncbi:hypothetical protein AVEN_98516-1 [Araneus ventricosus]|uniref:Transposase Tc1-like domain-containing protein n=1 Tax=Araneus ventricosus TaxID=182803 RepID=A0A4Y2EQA4_ARAVE|nr:hypothetical protein AVEN_98516-1 [Araneus ventricosus]